MNALSRLKQAYEAHGENIYPTVLLQYSEIHPNVSDCLQPLAQQVLADRVSDISCAA